MLGGAVFPGDRTLALGACFWIEAACIAPSNCQLGLLERKVAPFVVVLQDEHSAEWLSDTGATLTYAQLSWYLR